MTHLQLCSGNVNSFEIIDEFMKNAGDAIAEWDIYSKSTK